MLEPVDPSDPEVMELVAPWGPVPALGSPAEEVLARELIAVLQSWLRDQLAASRPSDIPPVTPISNRESLDTAG